MDVKQVLDENEDFVRKMVAQKGEVSPMLIWSVNKKVFVAAIVGNRDLIKLTVQKAKLVNPEWMCLMITGFMRAYDKDNAMPPDLKYGNLAKGYKWGDPTVKKVVILQALCNNEARSRIFEIDKDKVVKMIKEEEITNSSGYLDIGGE